MLFTDGNLLPPFIVDGPYGTQDLEDQLAELGSDSTDVTVNVNVQLPGDEAIPYHDRSGHAPVYVADWDSFVGQAQVKNQLRIHIDAATKQYDVLDHVLLASGMPGVGKTTMARLIAKEMCSKIWELVPPFTADTLYEVAQKCGEGDVLFIDEIHLLGSKGAENLLTLMEERTLFLKGKVIPLQEFTVIGATTDKDKLPEPILDRFFIKPEFSPYSLTDMVKIAHNFTKYFGVKLSPEVLVAIAKASRKTPRVARELVSGARDLSISLGRECTPAELLDFKDMTPDGLTRTHRAYLVALYSFFGRERDGQWEYVAGEASIANVLQENKLSVARLERFLIQNGLVDRTPVGRRLTDRGIARAREFAALRAGTAVNN